MNQNQNTGSIRDFLTVIFKHKVKIAAIFFLTVLTVTAVTFLLPPTYEAKSSLLVTFGREYVYRPVVGDKSPMIAVNQEETINSEINILTSQDLIEKVITAIKVENIYPELVESPPARMTPLQAAIIKFEKKLTVEGVRKSNVIEVSFKHKDPKIAAAAVNMLVDYYKEKHIEVYSNPQSSFLEEQLAMYDRKLKESEGDLEEFKQKNQVYSLDEQRSLLLKQHMDLDTNMKGTADRIDELKKRLSSLKAQMQAISEKKDQYTQTERDKIIVDAKAKLLDLRLEEQHLLEKYKETNPLIVNVRKEIGLISDFLNQQEEDITGKVKTGNAVYQEAEGEAVKAEADLSAQFAKEKTLGHQRSQVEKEIRSLDLQQNKNDDLKREVESDNKNYLTYVEKVEEARISADMDRQKMANVSVIEAAAIPAKPVKPKKALNIVLGIVLGAVSGLGFAFFSESASLVLSTPESVEKKLGLPVLTAVSYKE